jgi:Zn-dependent protease with chaperone function
MSALIFWETMSGFFIVLLLPFIGYLIFILGRVCIGALRYAVKPGRIDDELTSIAKLGYPGIKKVIIKESDILHAHINGLTKTIVVTRKLYETLTKEEMNAVLYHETAHPNLSHSLRVIVWNCLMPVLLIFYLVACLFLFFMFFFINPFFTSIVLALFSSAFHCCIILIYETIYWSLELKADIKSAERVGRETMISALRKGIPVENAHCDSHTHPSLERRISNLRSNSESQSQR